MYNFYGSVSNLRSYDRVHITRLVKENGVLRVVATCIKDRHGMYKEPPRILYEIQNSLYDCYLIERK